MAKAARTLESDMPPAGPVTETVTYVPGEGDPPIVKWCGHTFHANVGKEITGHPDGSASQQLNHHLIERARDNRSFRVGNAPRKRDVLREPQTADEYRAHIVEWLKDPGLQHASQLIERFAKERELREACEVGADDYAYIATLFMPKLHELSRGDELSQAQVAAIWIQHGINQLPW